MDLQQNGRSSLTPPTKKRDAFHYDVGRRRNTSPSDSSSPLSVQSCLTPEISRRREGRRVSFSNRLPEAHLAVPATKRKGSNNSV